MKAISEWVWLGIAIGAVWAFQGVDGAAITLAMGGVGLLIGLVIRVGGIRALLDQQRDDEI